MHPYQVTNGIFHRTRAKEQNILQFVWKHRHQIAKAILRKKNSNQDTMVLAQKEKYRSMEQDRNPRDKPMHIWPPYL